MKDYCSQGDEIQGDHRKKHKKVTESGRLLQPIILEDQMQKQKIEEDTEECSWRVKRKMRLAHAADSSRRNQHGKFMKIIRFEAVLFFCRCGDSVHVCYKYARGDIGGERHAWAIEKRLLCMGPAHMHAGLAMR